MIRAGQPGGTAGPWRASPAGGVSLAAGAVDVWRVTLGAELAAEGALSLSPDEAARAARFVFERDRERFVAARGWLRKVLAGYLGVAPATVAFAYGAHGKPELSGAFGQSGLFFNLSHSGDTAVLAVAREVRVGIDVEEIKSAMDMELVARSHFSAWEVAEWSALSAAERLPAFFRCWVRKEAYLKALGVGVSRGLGNFSASLRPDQPAALVADEVTPDAPHKWFMIDLPLEDGFAACLAVAGKPLVLRCFGGVRAKSFDFAATRE